MKTIILITGSGLSSKLTLLAACKTYEAEQNLLIFNNYRLIFATKKEAVKALSEAYKHLHADKEDWNNSAASYRRGDRLSYDAATARIEMYNN